MPACNAATLDSRMQQLQVNGSFASDRPLFNANGPGSRPGAPPATPMPRHVHVNSNASHYPEHKLLAGRGVRTLGGRYQNAGNVPGARCTPAALSLTGIPYGFAEGQLIAMPVSVVAKLAPRSREAFVLAA